MREVSLWNLLVDYNLLKKLLACCQEEAPACDWLNMILRVGGGATALVSLFGYLIQFRRSPSRLTRSSRKFGSTRHPSEKRRWCLLERLLYFYVFPLFWDKQPLVSGVKVQVLWVATSFVVLWLVPVIFVRNPVSYVNCIVWRTALLDHRFNQPSITSVALSKQHTCLSHLGFQIIILAMPCRCLIRFVFLTTGPR